MLRLAAVTLVCWGALQAQSRPPRILAGDLAVLDGAQPRRDFPCSARVIKPALGFDLRLHAGYQASVRPARAAQQEGTLQVVTRVTPAGAQPVYLNERTRIPNPEETGNNRLIVAGMFALGEGSYRVDWLVRDQAGGVCSAHWSVEAKLPGRARDLPHSARGSAVGLSQSFSP